MSGAEVGDALAQRQFGVLGGKIPNWCRSGEPANMLPLLVRVDRGGACRGDEPGVCLWWGMCRVRLGMSRGRNRQASRGAIAWQYRNGINNINTNNNMNDMHVNYIAIDNNMNTHNTININNNNMHNNTNATAIYIVINGINVNTNINTHINKSSTTRSDYGDGRSNGPRMIPACGVGLRQPLACTRFD